MSLPSGTRLGRYEIRSPLGAGGMGEVYLAFDADLERDVAVKVLRADHDESPERVRRFVQEAKAASALNHPNVATVYEIGSADDLRFIAMEVIEGDTLRSILQRGPMALDDVLSIGTQVASALAAAHRAGIVHRDVKPENVIVRPDGYVKVLDFGLAKLNRRNPDAATVMKTDSGVVMGTLRYMAPEQLSGSDVTAAADVFSLGVVLYELATGRRPFEGNTATEVATAILTRSPAPIASLRSDVPPGLAAVIAKALQKEPARRYPSAEEMAEDLKQISRESMATADLPQTRRASRGSRKRRAAVIASLFVVAIVLGGLWMMRRARRIEDARAVVARAQKLVDQKAYADAFDAVSSVVDVLPQDKRVGELLAKTSVPAKFTSEPPGAAVYLERFRGKGGRVRMGTTPLTLERLARADYVLTFEKEGFVPAARPLSVAPRFNRGWEVAAGPANVAVKLLEARRSPPGMVYVEGGPYRLTGWSRASDREVVLADFLIDRCEVSNREFEGFVRDGGYRRRELWKHPFVADGRTLSFDEAMARFHDTTGLPGPRGWVGGAPPAGRENHPVTGVSWYEAAAFAEWKGKALPTIYEWEKAARPPRTSAVGTALPWTIVLEGVDVTDRANFGQKGTLPVDSMAFGLSPWGALHMAGNAAEWCVNERAPGFVVRGGSWNDAVYTFGRAGSLPSFYASDTVGFRCAKELTPGHDNGSFALNSSVEVPVYKAVDDTTFEAIRHRYDYVKSPLNPRVIETIEAADWRREKIVYTVNGKQVPAYLYIPRGFSAPLQVIYYSPPGDVADGARALPSHIESSLAPYIRGGRVVFSVVMEGFVGRPSTIATDLDSRSDEYVDYVVTQVTELRRGLDYLETRKDLDTSRIAFIGPSAGSWAGVILTALEQRFRSVLFIGTRIRPTEVTDAPAANRINFAPRISAPVMMLQGRYDESAVLETQAMPLFRLLREPKRIEVYEGSHVPSMAVGLPITTRWLDETLGPVGR